MPLGYRFINAPSEFTKRMLLRRMSFGRAADDAETLNAIAWGAVLLVQGTIPELFYAVDVGTKASAVYVGEVLGNCPQNIVSMAFVGSVADVRQVLAALKSEGVVA
jgi:hypothetical protein